MKKLMSVLIALICVMAFSTTGFAATSSNYSEETEPYAIITPRYVCILSIISDTNIGSASASGKVQVSLRASYTTTIKIVLEVSKDGGKTYSTDSTLANKTVTSASPSANGSKSGLNSSYTYRTKTTISVFNSSGAEIDGDEFYSY